MCVATSLKFVFIFVCHLWVFTNFVLNDVNGILLTEDHQILSDILNHCNFSDEHLNHSEIVCERLETVTIDEQLHVDDFFLRTKFTFKVLDEEDINAENVDFRCVTHVQREERSGSVHPEHNDGNMSERRQEILDEFDRAHLSQNEDVICNVSAENKTMQNKTKTVIMSKLVTLTKLKLQKVENQYPWRNATVTQLERGVMSFLLKETKKFVWAMDFNSSFPVGFLDLDEGCFHKTG